MVDKMLKKPSQDLPLMMICSKSIFLGKCCLLGELIRRGEIIPDEILESMFLQSYQVFGVQ